MKYNTKLIHIGEQPNLKDGGSGDVVIPIHLASTFARVKVDKPTNGFEYSRSGNPTRHALEQKLAVLEHAKYALAFSSGLAAETTALLSLIKSGDHIIASDDLYGGTRRLFQSIFHEHFNIYISYVDTSDLQTVSDAITKKTKLVWLESPTNPLLKISDISAISKIAKKQNIPVLVDNTFMSPYFQKPLELGADIVLHSTTKYINGHSDSIGGAIMLSNTALYDKIKFNQNAAGAILSPFDSYLVLRGIKTLAVRMDRHEMNAKRMADFLATHPKVSKIYFPGLKSHPHHDIAKKQMTGFGGMLSFEIHGTIADAKKFLSRVKLFSLAESLGGVESLIEHPALMTHASISQKIRKAIGVSDTLIRVSVGLEDAQDLIDDLNQAL